MALAHNGTSIPGSHESLQLAAAELPIVRSRYFGLAGETEIVGARGGRAISVRLVLHNGYSNAAACLTALDTLLGRQGEHGTLAETGNLTRDFANTTLKSVTLEQGPLPPSGTISGWFALCTLQFRQLKLTT